MTEISSVGEFRVGRAFSRAFELLFGDFAKFALLGGIVWLPSLLSTLVRIGTVQGFQSTTVASLIDLGSNGLVMAALQQLGDAVVLYGAFQKMRGRGFTIGESLMRGLSRLLPILGVFALMWLGMLLAAILLVFPALIVLSMWYVALPVCVVERQGPAASLVRSSTLTEGHRWKIFGIYLLLAVVNGVGLYIIEWILMSGGGLTAAVGVFLWDAIVGAYAAIIVAVVYHDLRVAKEGIDIERIAAVFD